MNTEQGSEIEENFEMDYKCPNCNRMYDEIDYEYQMCSLCKFENKTYQIVRKTWINLNSHGKFCLGVFISALSASDIRTSQIDYLFDKGIIDCTMHYKDFKSRINLANYCLTDRGVQTAIHYFPHLSATKNTK